ncbi:MAG: zinc-finger domain-containing protein [Zetaproteobacteria bacterium]|nr:zinc-finger domain-containing protein [Zetaproteobacteria bacterium]
MNKNAIKTTKDTIACSDNGQHPQVFINVKAGSGTCHYCGQRFEKVPSK